MGKGIRVTPGADPHADVAVRAHLAPVVKTGFRIQFPAPGTVDFFLIIQRYGIRWATAGALFANLTEIFNPNVDRVIGNQGKVRCHGAQSDTGPEIFSHQIPQPTGLPSPASTANGTRAAS